MRWFCSTLRWRSRKMFGPSMLRYCCITPNFPCKSGWKTPLKEHWLYLQLEELKMLLTIFWHWEKFPVPL